MKIHEFKTAVWGGFFIITYLSLFIYMIIWLNNGFKVEDIIEETKKELRIEINNSDNNLRNVIMPSCYIKEPKWTRKQHGL